MSTAAPLRTSAMIASFADPGQKTTPAPFGHALVQAAQADDRIVGLTADLGKYTDMHIFAQAFPDRYFQMGMAEQLLFGAAAGMAETGLVPFASTYSVFATRRAYDFICLDIAEPGLNVNIVGGLPGLTTGYGPSHQATEDIAIFRGIPGLTIVDPCDSVDIEQAVPQLAEHDGPTYLRLLRGQVPTVLDEYDYTFELGKAKVLRDGTDVVLISSGLMTMRALQAAKDLADAQRRRRRRTHTHNQAVRHRNRAGTGEHGPTRGDLRKPHRDRRAIRDGSCQRQRGRDSVARSCRSPCPMNSSPQEHCPPCTSATAWRRPALSPPCWNTSDRRTRVPSTVNTPEY